MAEPDYDRAERVRQLREELHMSPGPKRREWAPLADVETVSGCARDPDGSYRGFVTIRALAEDGSHMAGQIDPGELRRMGLYFIEAAEAAESDAIVASILTEIFATEGEVPDPQLIGSVLVAMRSERGKHIAPRDQEEEGGGDV